MPPTSSSDLDKFVGANASKYWLGLAAIVVLATLVRMLFFTGFFGSDEIVFATAALNVANGQWVISNYVGALRYGVNLPTAFFMILFGASEFSANLWSFLCSLGEVVLVFVFAHRLWGNRAALLSAVVIALLPLHVHFGGRLMPDAPLTFFITLSFLLFWTAERNRSSAWYFSAGLAAGFVYWIKELVIVYWLAFAVYALIQRNWRFKWLWVVFGALTAIGANCLLLWAITGDPLHIYHVMRATTDVYVVLRDRIDSSPWYYFRYWFADMRHTWLMPYLAVAGIWLWAGQAVRTRRIDAETGYVVLWAVSLIAIFSFMPISFNPFILIAKQTNYMLIFVAPFCMLAGYWLARLRGRWLAAVLTVLVAGSLALAALEQQAVRVFTANSMATVAFAQRHRDTPVYALTNAYRAGIYVTIMQGGTGENPVRSMDRINLDLAELNAKKPVHASRPIVYAIVDMQTINWKESPQMIRALHNAPTCWERVATLEPGQFGIGKALIENLQMLVELLPQVLVDSFMRVTQPLVRPQPAYVYAIPRNCDFLL